MKGKPMPTAIVKLKGISPMQQGKHYDKDSVPIKGKVESHADYEKRTWRNRCHQNAAGNITAPPMAFKKALEGAAKYGGMKIQGSGQKTWTKKFEAGVMVVDEPEIFYKGKPIKADEVGSMWLFVPSDGKSGGGSRVNKCFPTIPQDWECEVTYHILDDQITKDIFVIHIDLAGKFVGLGVFRPEHGGYFGRYVVTDIKWATDDGA